MPVTDLCFQRSCGKKQRYLKYWIILLWLSWQMPASAPLCFCFIQPRTPHSISLPNTHTQKNVYYWPLLFAGRKTGLISKGCYIPQMKGWGFTPSNILWPLTPVALLAVTVSSGTPVPGHCQHGCHGYHMELHLYPENCQTKFYLLDVSVLFLHSPLLYLLHISLSDILICEDLPLIKDSPP